jgi:NarL family two-component system sensor histidine kinase LiaS
MSRFPNRLTARFQQLRWKLTLSYTIVTVGALLAVELVLIIGAGAYLMVNSRLTPRLLIEDMNSNLVPTLRPYLSEIPIDIEMLWLKRLHRQGPDTSPISIMGSVQLEMKIDNQPDLFLITADGTLLDTLPNDLVEPERLGQPFEAAAIPSLEGPLRAALAGVDDYRRLYTIDRPDNRLAAAVPIFDKDGQRVVGALAFTTDALPWSLWSLSDIAQQIGYSLVGLTLLAGVMGTIFGSLTARSLGRRLRLLSRSADAWSRGDFSVMVHDPAADELGHLARDLNQMAGRLESLLDKRQEMSVLEERNRLARDLHDSAKQQAFAASAQLGAARARFKVDPQAAEAHLAEADALVDQVRQELTHLIQELRPAALQGTGLATALRDHALDWANQNDVNVDVRIRGARALPLEVEQSLFRIAQEALSNIARHSQARNARVLLAYNAGCVTLDISDDGQGFDVHNSRAGMGLRSMRERAQLLKGDLVIQSTVESGTRVSAKCPN